MFTLLADFWKNLDKWVKRIAAIAAIIALLSQFSSTVLSITLDNRYILSSDATKYVTQSDMLSQSRSLGQQIQDTHRTQLESEKRRLQFEERKLEAKPNKDQADRENLLQIKQDLRDVQRQLDKLNGGKP